MLIPALLDAMPSWPRDRNWGYAPSGALAAGLIIARALVLLGHI